MVVSRRGFCVGAGATTTAIAVGGLGLTRLIRGSPAAGAMPLQEIDPGWFEPQILESADGVLDVELTAAAATWNLNGTAVSTNLFEGSAPGPTLRVRGGDTLRVLLRNQMDQETNLHVHGMHVSPDEPADSIYHSVASGEEYQYEYAIPEDHPPGTYWYHPHQHPYTGAQVAGGLAGMIQVIGALDDLPAVAGAVQRQIVLQGTFVDVEDGSTPPPNFFCPIPDAGRDPTPEPTAAGGIETAGVSDDMPPANLGYYQVQPVNGIVLPRLAATSGGVERWRIVNASFAFAVTVALDDHPLHVIAVDGNPVAAVHSTDEWVLPPGGRIDVLVVPGAPGTYALRSRDMSAWNPDSIYLVQNDADTANERLLVEMDVSGPQAERSIPTTALPGFTADLRDVEVDVQRNLTTDQVDGEWAFGDALWDADRIDQEVSLWAVEEWVFTDEGHKMHPIHIHQNPFQVVARNGIVVDEPWWRDTAIVPNSGSLTIRTYFRDFAGKYPMHCHNLNHEDGGMMQNILVSDDGTYQSRPELP